MAAVTVQTCVVHLIRNTFRLSGRQHWDALKHDLRPIYTAPTEATAHAALDALAEHLVREISGDHPIVDQRLAEIHPVPRLRNRDTASSLRYQRNRVPQCLVSKGSESSWPFPQGGCCAQLPYLVMRSLDPPGKGSDTIDNEVEACCERVAITVTHR